MIPLSVLNVAVSAAPFPYFPTASSSHPAALFHPSFSKGGVFAAHHVGRLFFVGLGSFGGGARVAGSAVPSDAQAAGEVPQAQE